MPHSKSARYVVGVKAFVFSLLTAHCTSYNVDADILSVLICETTNAEKTLQQPLTTPSCVLRPLYVVCLYSVIWEGLSNCMAERKMDLFCPKPSTKEQNISSCLYLVGWLLKRER